MNDPVILRAKVREVLALNPRRPFTEKMLFDGVAVLVPAKLTVPELRAAIEWNHARNFIDYTHDADLEADVWSLTKNGKNKEGL